MRKRLHLNLVQSQRPALGKQGELRSDPSLEVTMLWRLKTMHPPSKV